MPNEPTAPEVGLILEQLRAEVRARRLADGSGELSPVERDLRRSLDEIELYRVVSAHWPLKARSPFERVVVLVNKMVRRLLRWYINPIVEQQNAYNDAVARALHLLSDAYAELAEDMRTQKAAPDERTGGNGQPGGQPGTQVTNGPTLSYDGMDRTQLQALVEQRGSQEPPARFIELDLHAAEPALIQRQDVSSHWPIQGQTPIGRGVALAQKLVRQYLRWLINPIVEQQNAANQSITAAVQSLTRVDADRRARLAAVRARGR
jgi:hypothetical protein